MALPVMEFIRRFLQHVLPTGFMKVRHYGFMSPTSSVELDEIRNLIELSYGFNLQEPEIEIPLAPHMACPHCGGMLKFRLWIPPMPVLQPG